MRRVSHGLLLLACAPLAGACTQILGGFELAGTGGGASSSTSTGTGGVASSSTTSLGGTGGATTTTSGTGGTTTTSTSSTGSTACTPETLEALCTGKTCSDVPTDACGTPRRCGSCTQWSWVAAHQGATDYAHERGVAVDANGIITLTGGCRGMSFGGGSPACATDAVYLARLDTNGAFAGKQTWAAPYASTGEALVVRKSDGHVFFAGRAEGSLNFGQGSITSAMSSATTWVAEANNTPVVVQSAGSTNQGYNRALGIALDNAGNVFVAGHFVGAMSLPGCNAVPTPDFPYDGFIAKLDSTLSCKWLKTASAALTEDIVFGVAIDQGGNAIVVGVAGATPDLLGCGPRGPGAFVAKLNGGNSQCAWAKTFQGTETYPSAVAVDGSGNIVFAGNFRGTFDLGGGFSATASANVGVNAYDAFVAKVDANGAPMALRAFGDDSHQAVSAIAIAANDDIVITGPFWGTVDFGGKSFTNPNPDPNAPGSTANYNPGGFVARLDTSLGHVWSVAFTKTALWLEPNGVAFGPLGDVIVAGNFYGVFDFGNGTTQSANNSTFAVKLDP